MARDSFLEALEDPELIVQVQALNPPNLDSTLRVAQRMEAVFQTVHTRASKPVRVVSEGPVGPVFVERVKDPWIEQLTKAVQQLNQQLSQAKDPALDPTVVGNDPPVRPANRYDRGSYRQVDPTKPARLATVDVLTVAKRAILPEIVIRSVSRSRRIHVPLSSRTLILYGPTVNTPERFTLKFWLMGSRWTVF